jgi:arylsulfatase A
MKWILLLIAFLFGAEIAPAPASVLSAKPSKPNLILVMADDFGYECVGANGGESYETPHLDRLAASGVRFENCHSYPLCTPTRVAIMTGKHNVRNYLNFGSLPRSERTFAHLLKEAGYTTGICGKWQLGKEADSPQHFGFDESLLWQQTRRPPRFANPGLERQGIAEDYADGEYGPTLINDFALDFLTRHREGPFFLYYPMILTHDPFQPTPESPDWDPKAIGERVNRDVKHFAEMTGYMDKMIGRLDAKLDELGIRDNTLLLFLGDNGTHSSVTSRFKGTDYPGGKGTTTARGTHVPLIASWPGVVTKGRVNRDLIGAVDFLPTLCEAAGVALPGGTDGISFLPFLRGGAGKGNDALYLWYSPRQKPDLSVKEYAFDLGHKLYRDGRFYDLVADPFEETPLAEGSAPDAKERLRVVLDRYADARPPELDRAFLFENSGATSRPAQGKNKSKTPRPDAIE